MLTLFGAADSPGSLPIPSPISTGRHGPTAFVRRTFPRSRDLLAICVSQSPPCGIPTGGNGTTSLPGTTFEGRARRRLRTSTTVRLTQNLSFVISPLRTACTGSSTSPSARMTAASAKARPPRTSPSSGTAPSTSSNKTNPSRSASRANATWPAGTTTTCSASSALPPIKCDCPSDSSQTPSNPDEFQYSSR